MPSSLSFTTNPSPRSLPDESKAPGVTGKSNDAETPPAYACPSSSTASACTPSQWEPPMNVDQMSRLPSGVNFETKPSLQPSLFCTSAAPGVTGKSSLDVPPATYTFPAASSATASAWSLPLPPR